MHRKLLRVLLGGRIGKTRGRAGIHFVAFVSNKYDILGKAMRVFHPERFKKLCTL